MPSVVGKQIVITGASAGIGAAAAAQLSRLGAELTIVGHSPDKTARVAEALGARAKTVDFADLTDVRRLADELSRELERIDVLVQNAGLWVSKPQLTVDGIDAMFQINTVAPWLLLQELTPTLAGGRVISTNSASHLGSRIDPDTVAADTKTASLSSYGRAKLGFGLLLREYGRRHPGITVADFHPGLIASDFTKRQGLALRVAFTLARPLMESSDRAAARLVTLATTDEPINGRYFDKEKPAVGNRLLQDQELAARLWRQVERLTLQYRDSA